MAEVVTDPVRVNEIFARALEDFQAGRFPESEKLMRSIVRPEFAEAQLSLGNALLAQHNIGEAIACYRQALSVKPDFALAQSNLKFALDFQTKTNDELARWNAQIAQHDYTLPAFSGASDQHNFSVGLAALIGAVPASGRFSSDNVVTWGRNLSFLDDRPLMDAMRKNCHSVLERAIIWRTAVLVWAARHGLRREGEFVECGVWNGTTARIICDTVDFKTTGKQYWLYDVFDWKESDLHHHLHGLDSTLHSKVVKRFEDLPTVRIVKGYVPESFAQGMPAKISLLHLDMNNAPAEMAALDTLWDRVVPGGIIILDDYGWEKYRPQKLLQDEFLAARGYAALEIPTGQGIILK